MANEKKKISIIIPVYKVEEYIADTIQSLLNQTCKDFEIILVDDGSPDKSVEIAEAILKNSGVDYKVLSQENSGQGIARNTGARVAETEWLMFLDSDDVLQEYTIEHYCKIVEQYTNAEMVYSNFQKVTSAEIFKRSEESFSPVCFDREEMTKGFLTRKKVPLVPGTLYKTSFLKENNIFHNDLRWSEDQYFMWLVLSKITNAVYTNSALYNYRTRENSIMTSTPVERVLDAYQKFQDLAQSMEEGNVKKYMLARWVLGCVHSVAKSNEFEKWESLLKEVDYKKHLKRLLSFPSLKIKALSLVGLTVSKKSYYKIVKRL